MNHCVFFWEEPLWRMGPCGFLAGCYPPNGLPVRTLKIGVPKRNCYHPKSMFRGYVSFREGTYTPFRKLTWQAGKYHVFAIVIFYAHLPKSVLLFCFFFVGFCCCRRCYFVISWVSWSWFPTNKIPHQKINWNTRPGMNQRPLPPTKKITYIIPQTSSFVSWSFMMETHHFGLRRYCLKRWAPGKVLDSGARILTPTEV